ncbi:MAG: DUF3047 domain-containing protein [Granulosicoccus sp.]
MPTTKTSRTAYTLITTALCCMAPQLAQATTATSDRPLSEFADTNLDRWSERSFSGNTHYELIEDEGVRVLKAHTQKQASILYREESIDLRKRPVINWSWKIDHTYVNIDEQTRNGDDFPARLYVVAQVGFLPWETVSINYVWASEIPVGEIWSNPFSEKAKMVAIQSGDKFAGKWTSHSRNVVQDFKAFFNHDIEQLSGYAVMVDGDNAQMEATAWFGEIGFSPLREAD